MRVRGSEHGDLKLRHDLSGPVVVCLEVFEVVHLDTVNLFLVGPDVVSFEADRRELGMGNEDGRPLPFEFRHRALESDEIRNGIGESDREDMLPIPPIAGEYLAPRNDQQLVIGEALRAGSDLGEPGKMRRVYESVESASFRPFDDSFVEYFYVPVEAKPVHTTHTESEGVIRSDSSGSVLYMDTDETDMWECAIGGCEYATDDAEELLVHQARSHERHRCAVCGTTVPDGYFAIRHAFSEHSRADYLRSYEADTDDIRLRETVLTEIEAEANVESVVQRLSNSERDAKTEA